MKTRAWMVLGVLGVLLLIVALHVFAATGSLFHAFLSPMYVVMVIGMFGARYHVYFQRVYAAFRRFFEQSLHDSCKLWRVILPATHAETAKK